MDLFVKPDTRQRVAELTLEDTINKLASVTRNSDSQLSYVEFMLPFGYYPSLESLDSLYETRSRSVSLQRFPTKPAEEKPEKSNKIYVTGKIDLQNYTGHYIDNMNFCKIYYFNNLKRISYGLTIDIELGKPITLLKDSRFFYEFRQNHVLKLSRLLATLDLKTVKTNLNEFLFETQSIVLKLN